MKRFATAIGMCVLLIGVSGAYATDYTWDGDTDDKWETATNWVEPGAPGNLGRCCDRAYFGDGSSNATIVFDDSSGLGYGDSRVIVEFFMVPDSTDNLTLNVAGDKLYVWWQFIMRSTADASVELLIDDGSANNQEGGKLYVGQLLETTAVGNASTITVNDENAFLKVGRLLMSSTSAAAPLDIDGGKVIVTGELVATAVGDDVTISVDGSTAVMYVERMVLTNSATKKAQLTVSTATSGAKVHIGELIMDGSSATAAGGKATLDVDNAAELHMGSLDVKGQATYHASLAFDADSTVGGMLRIEGDTDMNIGSGYSVVCGRCVFGASTEIHMTGSGTLSCG